MKTHVRHTKFVSDTINLKFIMNKNLTPTPQQVLSPP